MYYTYSIYTSAFLMSKGFQVVKTERDENGKIKFYFEESEVFYGELRKFRNNKFFKEYIKNINEMKKVIHEGEGKIND